MLSGAALFLQLIRLFPIECPEVGVCYLPAGAASALPDFSFRVRGFTAKESSKKDGQLYISLSHLLLDADPNDSLHRRRFLFALFSLKFSRREFALFSPFLVQILFVSHGRPCSQ